MRVYFVPASSGVHDSLAITLSEGIVEVSTVVLSKVVTGEGLTTVLVDTLEDLERTEQGKSAIVLGLTGEYMCVLSASM